MESFQWENIINGLMADRDRSQFGLKEKIFFFRELAYLIDGGVSLRESLDIIEKSADDFAIKEIASTLNAGLDQGKLFSSSMLALTGYFDESDVTIIKSGERSGNLGLVLHSLAHEYDFLRQMRAKYVNAMTYPIILLVISFAAVIVLFTTVLPSIFQIVATFDNVQIPYLTQLLMRMSNFFVHQWGSVLAGVGIVAVIFSLFLQTNAWSTRRYRVLFNIPFFGQLSKYYFLIKFCRYSKIMLRAGMNYVQIFKLLREIMDVPLYNEMIDRVLEGINRGERIYDTIQYETEVIPANVWVLLKVGEETAKLEQAFDNIVVMYEEDLNNNLQNLSKVIEPLLIVIVGGVITVIALSVFDIIGTLMNSLWQ